MSSNLLASHSDEKLGKVNAGRSNSVYRVDAFAPQLGLETAMDSDDEATLLNDVVACEDNLVFMSGLADETFKLIVTSPPYNLGKEYEGKAPLETYLNSQERVIAECVRLLRRDGSICWQVGNYVKDGEIVPLDAVRPRRGESTVFH